MQAMHSYHVYVCGCVPLHLSTLSVYGIKHVYDVFHFDHLTACLVRHTECLHLSLSVSLNATKSFGGQFVCALRGLLQQSTLSLKHVIKPTLNICNAMQIAMETHLNNIGGGLINLIMIV